MNIFLFFYLFILFVLLTPGTLITLSIVKQSSSSKWIVAAIHGFLFSVIAITTYSFVNDLYLSLMNPIQDTFVNVNTGYTFTSSDGNKPFNTLSDTPPTQIAAVSGSGPNIKCGKNMFLYGENWCGSVDPGTKQVFCYGDKKGCLIGKKDCDTDSDCKKQYSETSARYSDYSINPSYYICDNYPANSWSGKFCKMFKYPTKG